jgi:hypothetical protein
MGQVFPGFEALQGDRQHPLPFAASPCPRQKDKSRPTRRSNGARQVLAGLPGHASQHAPHLVISSTYASEAWLGWQSASAKVEAIADRWCEFEDFLGQHATWSLV